MIKFFRKIRYNLMEIGKTGRYFKYAIGEIVLVVIGILIALQINNWNETRKTRLIEADLLYNIKSDLRASHHSIEEMVIDNSEQLEMYKKLLYHAKNNIAKTEGLEKAFGFIPTWNTPYLTYSSYETLKAKGVDLIKNDSLKKQIVDIYDNEFAYLINDWDKWEWNNNQNITMPFFTKHFLRDSVNLRLAMPNNLKELVKNDEYSNILSLVLFTRSKGVREGKRINLEIENLIQNIDKELNDR